MYNPSQNIPQITLMYYESAWRAVRSFYVWADGIYVKAGLERDKAALLVVLGAMRDGTKEVCAGPAAAAGAERGEGSAVDVLEDDWERMVAFYDFPEDHWKHLRTTNVVESPFAAVRLRTTAAKRFKRVESATALIWKLLLVAEKRFRRLDAPHLLKDVFEGRKFEDGKPVSTQQRKNAA